MSLCSLLFLIIYNALITLSSECIDKSGSAISGNSNHNFTVYISTNCANSSITLRIIYVGYHFNWFGIVFADSMIGNRAADALVFTTGKTRSPQRDLALYSYLLKSRSLNASGVIYNGADKDPIEIYTKVHNDTIDIMYDWNVYNASFLHHNHIPFMWAHGNSSNDHQLSYHKGDSKATEAVTITLTSADTTTTSAPFECAHVDMFPLNICTQVSTQTHISSQKYICDANNLYYVQNKYDDAECNGNIIQNISHSCPQQGCICNTANCDYALTKTYKETVCAHYKSIPLNICIQQLSGDFSSQIVCNDGIYQRNTYLNGICNGDVIQTNTLECEEGIDCVCASDAECGYAIFKEIISANATHKCPGLEWKESAVVLNQCVIQNGINAYYNCSGDTLTINTDICGENEGVNTSIPCDLECVDSDITHGECSGDHWMQTAYLLNECMTDLNKRISCAEDEDMLLMQQCNDTSVVEYIPTCDKTCIQQTTTSIPENVTEVLTTTSSETETTTEECVEKAGDITDGLFTIKLRIDCDENKVNIEIIFSGYSDQKWFAVLFTEEDTNNAMKGDALIYTVGKRNEEERNEALYSYILSAKSSFGVTYDEESNWNKISMDVQEGAITVVYEQYLDKINFDIDANTPAVPIRWAFGQTEGSLILEQHAKNGRASETLYLELNVIESETISPTVAPTSAPEVKDETWFIISITFIILFCISAIALLYWLYLYCSTEEKKTKGGYHETEQEEIEAGEEKQTTVQDVYDGL